MVPLVGFCGSSWRELEFYWKVSQEVLNITTSGLPEFFEGTWWQCNLTSHSKIPDHIVLSLSRIECALLTFCLIFLYKIRYNILSCLSQPKSKYLNCMMHQSCIMANYVRVSREITNRSQLGE